MEPLPEGRQCPEHRIEVAIIKALRDRGWFVMKMHGSIYQSGFPDLFAAHKEVGIRLIEIKLPGMKGSKFTRAQKVIFPALTRAGVGIWILTSVDEIPKLGHRPNWTTHL